MERNLVSEMSDDILKKASEALSSPRTGYRSDAISAVRKRLLHIVNLFIFPVFSKPNCFLTELFQQLVQCNREAGEKPLT